MKDVILKYLEKMSPFIHDIVLRLVHLSKYYIFRTLRLQHGTLIYVGLNVGDSFESICYRYEIAIGIEANPRLFYNLQRRFKPFKNVSLFSFAASNHDGTGTLMLPGNSENFVSASLDSFSENRPWQIHETIVVETRNLGNFLREIGINQVQLYLSDCEGYDLEILKTLKYFLKNSYFYEIQCEVQVNGKPEIYQNTSNKEAFFEDLLGSNYLKIASGTSKLENGILNPPPFDYYFYDVKWRRKIT